MTLLEHQHRPARAVDEPAAGRARLRDRFGGPDGNERLTAVTGFVLIVLLFGEGLTLLQLRQHLSWHIGLGLALIPPIGLKLASVGWRFARYYLGHRAYVEKGPPSVALRLMGPLLVVATVALLATGVGLIVIGPGRGLMLNLHKASFLLWLWLTGAHVLLHLRGALSATGRELRRGAQRVAGGPLRRYALLAALVAGLVVGLATIPAQTPWLNWVRTHQSHEDGRG